MDIVRRSKPKFMHEVRDEIQKKKPTLNISCYERWVWGVCQAVGCHWGSVCWVWVEDGRVES